MITCHSNIGRIASIAASLCAMFFSTASGFAAESSSYILQSDSLNVVTQQSGNSTSYSLHESGITWYQIPAASGNFQIVPAMNAENAASSENSSSSSTVTTASSGGNGRTSGSRRPRVDIAGAFVLAPSSSSSSSSSRKTLHAAPTDHVETSGADEATSSFAPIIEGIPALSFPTISFNKKAEDTIPRDREYQRQGTKTTETLHRFEGIDPITEDSDAGLSMRMQTLLFIVIYLLIAWRLFAPFTSLKMMGTKTREKNSVSKHLFLAILLTVLGIGGVLFATSASAAQSVPLTHVYNGRLLTSAGTAITTAHSVRFSYWKSADAVSGDITGTGSINTGATNFASWQEVHTVTPNAQGYFSVKLGSVTALPTYQNLETATLLGLFLQVEVKASADANTAYEILDIDSTDSTIDRSGVLSVPFAANADTIDQREIGTGSGSIAVLGPNGQFQKSVVPGGTNSGSFVLDADNTESSEINLQFGTTLAKRLTYDITNSTFKFNTNLRVEGNLTVTGLVNGLNLTQLQSSTGALKAASGGGLNLNVSNGTYRLNGTLSVYSGGSIALHSSSTNYVFFGSGGLLKNSTGFPTDESFIPVAIAVTSAGSVTSVLDRRALSSDNREHTVVQTFSPSYEKASFNADGTSNVGQLSVLYDSGSLKNYYNWTSTRTSLQDYDIVLRVPVTQEFVRWKTTGGTNPLTLSYRSLTGSTLNNKLDIAVYDTAGSAVTLSGSVTGLSGTAWATTQIEFTGSPAWTAGQSMIIKLKPSAKDSFAVHIGELKLTGIELLGQ